MVTSPLSPRGLFLLCLAAAATTYAAPAPSPDVSVSSSSKSPRTYPIVKKRTPTRTGDDLLSWANNHRSHLQGKYGFETATSSSSKRRDVGVAPLVNYQHDSTWYATFEVGTPAKALNLVLDTGSSDIWVSASNFTPSASSTFSNASSAFSITYGSGAVNGYEARDTFTLAGHTVPGMPFAVATEVSSNLEDDVTSGIAGLGFQALSSANSVPFWQAANESEFSFYLQRSPSTDDVTVSTGGYFTLGGTNTSLYQGDINWSNVISKTYWLITLGGVSVADSSIDIGSTNKAAIDSGTTLIGGPESVIAAMYSKIDGASAIEGADGYYQYPCDSSVNATLTFGNQQYSLGSDQFEVAALDSSGEYCMGAFFSVGSTSASTLQWIVGDAFLSSVYTIMQNGDTARVGFAALADGLNDGGASSTTVARTQPATTSGAAQHKAMAAQLAVMAVLAAVVGQALLC
ncbi:acid protease [Jaminaea rosea]|uniref:Acid protease n=1 Tax=Jaminaea rosea TaxID=1569628 RepID=A0A316UR12_9BASI|nr:acid protease [Jaminaea rosea]PWN27740.1 acid protease [Jaminaea rosea]